MACTINSTPTSPTEYFNKYCEIMSDPIVSAIYDHAEAMGHLNHHDFVRELFDADFNPFDALEICDILFPQPEPVVEEYTIEIDSAWLLL